jgi:hypothetical protein
MIKKPKARGIKEVLRKLRRAIDIYDHRLRDARMYGNARTISSDMDYAVAFARRRYLRSALAHFSQDEF